MRVKQMTLAELGSDKPYQIYYKGDIQTKQQLVGGPSSSSLLSTTDVYSQQQQQKRRTELVVATANSPTIAVNTGRNRQ